MTARQIFLLSPYRPPTSYPVTLNADETAAWLNGHAALWHPAVLQNAIRPPLPASSYDHDLPSENFVYAVAEGPTLYQPDDWLARASSANAIAFRSTACRTETFANMRTAMRERGTPESQLAISDSLVGSFAGLGYGYLMVDTLFDAMSHDKLLDADGFWADVSAAVEAAMRPDGESESREKLRDAAKRLQLAREGASSGTIHLMEWIMRDPAHPDQAWPAALTANVPVSIIMSADDLEKMSVEHPERFAELKARVPADLPASADLCVGSFRDRDDALLPIESQLWNIRTARETVRKLFGSEPTVYARRRSAYHPQLPSWLQLAGYRHAVAVSFDGALVPSRYSAVVTWSGPDGKSVEAFTREPHPANDGQTFFNMAYLIHQGITHDSTPTVALLHKGGTGGAGYIDYLALGELAPVLGTATNLSRYFAEIHAGDYAGAANPDEFFADYLDERTTNRHRPDPVSGFAAHLRARRRVDGVLAIAALYRSLANETEAEAAELKQLLALEDAIETRGPELGAATQADELLPQVIAQESSWAKKLAERIQVRSVDAKPGFLAFNPCSFTRRITLELADQPGPIALDGPVKASEWEAGKASVVVEVPGLGFAWFPKGDARLSPPKPRIKTADGTTVRNEFFEATLDPVSGGLRAFRDVRTRINRLGQQLVFNPGSRMKATTVTVTHAGAAYGEVTSEGQIVDEHDAPLANFRQRIRAWVGRPVLELRIEILPVHRPTGYPWHAFYGARFGCRDDRMATFRGVNGTNSVSTYPRPVSPDYIEFRLAAERTFLFAGGLPFVQRHDKRTMDLVLIPEGETATTFDVLIAADREHPMQTASGWVAPAPIIETAKGPPHIGATGWLAAVDMPSLLMTSLRPTTPTEGNSRAVAARFVETSGYAGAAEFRFARDPSAALLIDITSQKLSEIAINEGALPLEFSASELLTVKAEWQ